MIEPLFKQMNLMEPLLQAVEQCGYHTPTPIQQETIPPVLEGRDVLGCAQTGTGKTAAFALPILQRLAQHAPKGKGRPIRALVLTPTRELALQIYENFTAYGKKLPLRSCVIFGGVGQQPQVDALRKGVEILVATPGRLNDLIGQGHISLAQLEIFVLDEADRMLDMGFIHDVKRVIAQLPQKRQTLFFSATMPEDVEKLALSILSDPVTVKVDPVSSTVDTIRQYLYKVDKANKRHLLADLLKKPNVESALVFTRTKHGADRVVRELGKAGITARAIHGDKSQTARQEALSQFKKGKIHVLIATDIAARGIDIAGLSHVFNYDLPNEPEAYVHRIGRTGRAGHEGIAISFCCIDEEKQLKDIEKLINKKLKLLESQWPMQVFTETVKQPRPARKEKQEVQQSKAQHKAGKETVRPEKKEAKKQENTAKGSKDTKTVSGKEKKHSKPEQNAAAAQPKKAATENKASAKREKHKPENKQRSEKPARPEKPVTLQAERPQVIRPEKTPVRNDRFGPGSAAAAAMRSTPLERPVAVGLTEKKEPVYERERKQTVATSVTYRQYMENQRSQRRGALATGDDRR
ncbi:MAG: DEAD/DEAH box helicase [Clostridia bacterium]|nr:DEAD/DEAH box helicase [Clostridia bacterium]